MAIAQKVERQIAAAAEMAANNGSTLTKPLSVQAENQIHNRDSMQIWGDE